MNEDACGRRTPVQPDKEPMSLTSLMYLAVCGWLSKTDHAQNPLPRACLTVATPAGSMV